jgi:hypothetical protein
MGQSATTPTHEHTIPVAAVADQQWMDGYLDWIIAHPDCTRGGINPTRACIEATGRVPDEEMLHLLGVGIADDANKQGVASDKGDTINKAAGQSTMPVSTSSECKSGKDTAKKTTRQCNAFFSTFDEESKER